MFMCTELGQEINKTFSLPPGTHNLVREKDTSKRGHDSRPSLIRAGTGAQKQQENRTSKIQTRHVPLSARTFLSLCVFTILSLWCNSYHFCLNNEQSLEHNQTYIISITVQACDTEQQRPHCRESRGLHKGPGGSATSGGSHLPPWVKGSHTDVCGPLFLAR